MFVLYLYSFLAGMLAADGVPHFVKGVTGQQHQTPFGRPSSAMVNVAWGWANFVVAALLLHFAHPWSHLYRSSGLFGLGVLLMGLLLAYAWASHPESNVLKKAK